MLCLAAPAANAYSDASPLSVELVADEPLETYGLNTRIDVRTTVVCADASTCGTVTLTLRLDPTVSYDSHSVITADRSGTFTTADISVSASTTEVVFTIGSADHPFAAGDKVIFPVSVRVAQVVADPQLKFTASATGAGSTVSKDLTVVPPSGPHKVSISGCVWWDVDRDGFRGSTEAAAPGRPVTLFRASATVTRTDTDADGCYVFIGLEPSTAYRVQISPPAGAGFTGVMPSGFGSVVDADGVVDLVTPASGQGAGSPESADRTGLGAGLASVNLALRVKASQSVAVQPGDEVRLELTTTNSGATAALPGWQVTVLLPTGLSLVSVEGVGFVCSDSGCIAEDGLAAGGRVSITVVAQVEKRAPAGAVVAYVRPAANEVTEAVPLGSPPTQATKTESTTTDNDVRWAFRVGGDELAATGGGDLLAKGTLGVLLLVAGGGLLLVTRCRVAN